MGGGGNFPGSTFDPLASFLVGKQILDRLIFDYRTISKRLEIEGVFNTAKQEAVRGDTSPTLSALAAERLVEWKRPTIWPAMIGSFTTDSYATTNRLNPLNTTRLSVGEATPELGKWRANVVSN